MTHPTNLEYLAKDKINGMRAEGLRSQQLMRRGRRALTVKRTLRAAAGFAALVLAAYWLF